MRTNSTSLRSDFPEGIVQIYPYGLAPTSDPERGSRKPVSDRAAGAAEDLPYKVELWDDAKLGVEQVLAMTASGSIGYAAYYAATREYPNRYVTLRHKGTVISRWNAPTQ